MDDFLATENLCGQNLLQLVSRGSAIIAELRRLSGNIPTTILLSESHSESKTSASKRYASVLFDFQYFRDPEEFEKKINSNTELLELDHEFVEVHEKLLERFYKLFESIWIYQLDLCKYIDDINDGFYINYSLANIFQDINGKQLLCESLYLYGVILLSMDDLIPGFAREKMLVLLYRHLGEHRLINIHEVCKLCRSTGYVSGNLSRRPKNYPESYFSRYPISTEFVRLAIGKLQSDDIYLMSNYFPDPDHRTTRLSEQASMLYILLFFAPDILHNQKIVMREIVDKYFNDNWVISYYMSPPIDLLIQWAPYSAAKYALDNIFSANYVQELYNKNNVLLEKCIHDLKKFLTGGILQSDFILDNLSEIMSVTRSSNIALRWVLLHRLTKKEEFRSIICASTTTHTSTVTISILLNVAQFEFLLRQNIKIMLNQKEDLWREGQDSVVTHLIEISQYFTGEKALSRIKKDENMNLWFKNLAEEVRSLDSAESRATSTGRKIKGIINALQDVEQFEVIDNNIHLKSFLGEIREMLTRMIRTVNIKNHILDALDAVSDLSYAWTSLPSYLDIFHERIKKEPTSVIFLRALFLKAASILDVPMVRITAAESSDAESVAQYYSNQLVKFVKDVLEVIPISVFHVLSSIVDIQTRRMTTIPVRLEARDLKAHAQPENRFELSKCTYQVSVFTEGVLLMESTLLGIIPVDPRNILEEGLRRELVRRITSALQHTLIFRTLKPEELITKLSELSVTLKGLERAMEHIQDYIDISGLQVYHVEFSRVMNYHIEQEVNRYLQKKTFDSSSVYQSVTVPIPRIDIPFSESDSAAENFTGRLLTALLTITDATKTVYVPQRLVWYSFGDKRNSTSGGSASLVGTEVCSTSTFGLIDRALGAVGLRGMDRLLAFRVSHLLGKFLKLYKKDVEPLKNVLEKVI